MIITRTPFRISFFGGGTDFPEYFNENGGVVLSTTINKYCYIVMRNLPPFFDYKYRIRYTEREEVNNILDIEHPVVRESINKYIPGSKGLEVVHTSDIPAKSGIGSSSAFTVGMVHALSALKGRVVSKRYLASEAIEMEQLILKENVGCQDQVACSFGGFNRIDFFDKLHFYVNPITICKEKFKVLESNLMLFFTGFTRYSSNISLEHRRNISKNIDHLGKMKGMVKKGVEVLNSSSCSIDEFGFLLDETWDLKRKLTSKISTDDIDEIYKEAKSAGAIGGKILGAGGGGFMLLYVPIAYQQNVKKRLHKYLHVPFRFESLGSQIIMFSPEQSYI